MPLPVSTLASDSLNYSSRFLNRRSSIDKCLLRFSDEFLKPTDEISRWYGQQSSRRFQTIQYRKERTPIAHEFILLRLQGQDGDNDCHCRVERVGDPERLAQTVCIDGTVAEDYIQAIPLNHPSVESLVHNSDVVAEITFPQAFDLRDVLAICYGISTHFKAKRYTLQQYNCYFFSWTIILGLARACMDWESSISAPEHINKIRDRIMTTIAEQGLTRFHSIAYILSNCTEDMGEHPLDQAIKSRIYSSDFASSMTEVPQDVLWTDRFHIKLVEAIVNELKKLAKDSTSLLKYRKVVLDTMFGVPSQLDLQLADALGKLTQRAMVLAFEESFRYLFQWASVASPTCVLLKQRLGIKGWCKSLAHCVRNPGAIVPEFDEPPIANSESTTSGYRSTRSPARDLCFAPASLVLGSAARIAITCAVTYLMIIRRKYCRFGGYGDLDYFYVSKVPRIRATIRSAALEIARMPTYFAASKHLLLVCAGAHAAVRLDPASGSVLEHEFDSKFQTALVQGFNRALDLFNAGLQESHINILFFIYPTHVLRSCVATSISAILRIISPTLEGGWDLILLQQFGDMMAQAAERECRGLIEGADIGGLFQIVMNHDYTISEGAITKVDGRTVEGATEGLVSTATPFHNAQSRTNCFSGSWSYQKLQGYIRGRICQLSKRENNFAPYLKHLQFAKSAEVCQKEIEVTMEEIWRTSARLIKSQSDTVEEQGGERMGTPV